jgi:hypothetical protein
MKHRLAWWIVFVVFGLMVVWKGRVAASGITQSAYNLIENGGSALFRRTTLNFSGTVSCSDDSGNNRTDCVGSGGSSSGGTNTQTGSYVLTSSDSGKLVIMNCSSSCSATLYATPSSTYYVGIISVGSTVATVSLNSLDLNGSTSVPVLLSYQPVYLYSDGTNYWGGPPPVQGTNMTLTPASNGLNFAASGGGGGGSFAAAPPYYYDGTHYYVAATGYTATKPSGSPAWVNSVTPTNTAAGTNGDYIFSGTGNYWAEVSGTTSVEAEFALATANTMSSTGAPFVGIWVYDSTNSLIYFFGIAENNGYHEITFQSWSYSGSGNPAFISTLATYYSPLQANAEHLKLIKSGGTLTAELSLNGGVTFTTITTHSVGTIADGGYGMNSNGNFGIADILSLAVN